LEVQVVSVEQVDQEEQKVLQGHRVQVEQRVLEVLLQFLQHMLEGSLEVILELFVFHIQRMQLMELQVQVVRAVLVLQLKQDWQGLLVVQEGQEEFYILEGLLVTIPWQLLIVIIQPEQLMELRGLEDLLE
jgi:RNA polymerase subunit RPABC4/transcription elongation factor Spt4